MSFVVDFYNFSKASNSTARPAEAALVANCIIKRGSSVINPTIELNLGTSSAPSYNYAYIPNFGRYYWIREWTFDQALWTATMEVDALATARTYIGASSLYVLRAASEYDGYIRDDLYPADDHVTIATGTQASFNWSYTGGTYIVGIVSKSADIGSLRYYALSPSEMTTLAAYLLDDGFVETEQISLEGGSVALTNALVNPLQYFKSCHYIPLSKSALSGSLRSAGTLKVYNWDTGITAQSVDPEHPVHFQTIQIGFSKHPQAAARGQFLNDAPFTEHTLFAPVFGAVPLDPQFMIGETQLSLTARIDLITGEGALMINNVGTNNHMNYIRGMIGVPINLSQVTRDWIGATEAIASGALGSLMNPAQLGSNLINTIGNVINAMRPKCQSISGGGSFEPLMWGDCLIVSKFQHVVDDDLTEQGRPLCKTRTISSLSGYVQCLNGDIKAPYTRDELDTIRANLEGGFYYE